MNLQRFNSLLDRDFVFKAYSDSIDKSLVRLNSLLSVCQEYAEQFDPESEVDFQTPSLSLIQSSLTEHGIDPTSVVAVDDGFAMAQDLVLQYLQGYSNFVNQKADSIEQQTFETVTASGASRSSTIGDVFNSLKSSIVASATKKAGVLAAAYDSVADKLSKFNTEISQYFEPTSDIASGLVVYIKNVLINVSNPNEFIDVVNRDSNIDAIAQGLNVTPGESDFTGYTGATSISAEGFTVVGKVATTIGAAVGVAVKTVATIVGKACSWLFKKASKLVRTFSDPYDIKTIGKIDEDGPCVQGFQYQGKSYLAYDWIIPNISQIKTWNAIIQRNIGTWYEIRTKGGEIFFRWLEGTEISYYTQEINYHALFTSKVEVVFKPYALAWAPGLKDTSGNPLDPKVGFTCSINMAEWASIIDSAGTDAYCNTSDSSEQSFYQSFALGAFFTMCTLSAYVDALSGKSKLEDPVVSCFFKAPSKGTISNADFVKIVSGWNGDTVTPTFDTAPFSDNYVENQSFPNVVNIPFDLDFMGGLVSLMMMYVSINESKGLTSFIPYAHQTTSPSSGAFQIKTDSENTAVATALATTLISIAVVAVIGTATSVALKAWKKKLYWKRKTFVSTTQKKLNDGVPLTRSDKRKFLRYSRKLSGTDPLTSGISESATQAVQTSIDAVTQDCANILGTNSSGALDNIDLSTIMRLISG